MLKLFLAVLILPSLIPAIVGGGVRDAGDEAFATAQAILGLLVLVLGGVLAWEWWRRQEERNGTTPPVTPPPRLSPSPPLRQGSPPEDFAPHVMAPPVADGWPEDRIAAALGEIDWFQFERFCAALLRAEGLQVERKGGAQPDGGVDLVAERAGERRLIQCKHWRTWAVQERVVRELLGSMTHFGVAAGAIYTLRGATAPARGFAAEHGLEIVAAGDLAARARERLSPEELDALLRPEGHHCPKCEAPMVWRTGDFEPFWGCSRFPRCRGVLRHSGAR